MVLADRQVVKSMPKVKLWEDLNREVRFKGQDLLEGGLMSTSTDPLFGLNLNAKK